MKKIYRVFLKIIAFFIILLLVIIGVSRGLVSFIVYYKPEITQRISGIVGQPVEIGQIKAYWSSLQPYIEFHNLVIFNHEHQVKLLQVKKLKLSISVFSSLFHQRVIPHNLMIEGSQIIIKQLPDKSFSINGIHFPLRSANDSSNDLTYYKNIHYSISHIDLTWQDENKIIVVLYNLKATNVHHNHKIYSENAIVTLPHFEKSLILDHVSTDLIFTQNLEGLKVALTNIQLKNLAGVIQGKIDFNFLSKQPNGNSIDAVIDFSLDQLDKLNEYIPKNFLAGWLGSQLITGNRIHGQIFIKGPLDQFPFKDQTGYIRSNVYLEDVNFNLMDSKIVLQHLNGQLAVDFPNIKTTGLTGRWLGAPIIIEFNGNKNDIQANISGTLSIVELAKIQSLSYLRKMAEGTSPFKAEWQFSRNDQQIQNKFLFDSDLQGLQLMLPDPFKKTNTEIKPIHISMITSNNLMTVAVNYNKKINLTAQSVNKNWTVQIKSHDMNGTIWIPANLTTQSLKMYFKRFSLSSTIFANSNKSNSNEINIMPSQIPALEIIVNRLYYDNDNLGEIHLITTRHNNTLFIKKFTVSSPDVNLSITGRWDGANNQNTILNGHITTSNFGDFLKDWDITDSLAGSEGSLNFKLNWPGPIYKVNLPKLNGELLFSLDNGIILDVVDSKIDLLGNILNLISIDSLEFLFSKPFSSIAPKRKGFDFTVEEGHFDIVNGNVQTDYFYLNGRLAKVIAQGSIGLAQQNYNLYITITPLLTAFLPKSLALAGGPVMLGILWVSDKLMGGVLNGFFRQTYHVTGSWSKPIYKKVSDPPKMYNDRDSKQIMSGYCVKKNVVYK